MNGTNDTSKELLEPAKILRLKQLQPGDVLEVVRSLRRFMTQAETCGYAIYSDFGLIGGEGLEQEAEKTRRTLELATARVSTLLVMLENSPAYKTMRDEVMERQKILEEDEGTG